MKEEKFAEITLKLWREHQRLVALKKQFKPRLVPHASLGRKVLAFKTKREWDAYYRVSLRLVFLVTKFDSLLQENHLLAERELSGRK